jgi:hypothetical protein
VKPGDADSPLTQAGMSTLMVLVPRITSARTGANDRSTSPPASKPLNINATKSENLGYGTLLPEFLSKAKRQLNLPDDESFFVRIGDDFGGQTGPLLSPAQFDRF